MAQTGAPFTQDPAISLMNMLNGDPTSSPVGLWGSTGASASLPAYTLVRFDTKYSRYDKHILVIVERMPFTFEQQTLGMTRFRVTENRRIQIWCDTNQARNNRWLTEQELFRIINANPLYLQGNGIDYIYTDGQGVISTSDVTDTSREVGTELTLVKSYLNVKMVYDVIKV